MITVDDQDKAKVLRQRCQNYIDAYDTMEAALKDGYNVHGALGGLIGTAHMLEDQVNQMQETENAG